MAKGSQKVWWIARCLLTALFLLSAGAAEPMKFRPGRVIISAKPGREGEVGKLQKRKRHKLKKQFDRLGGIQVVETDPNENPETTASEYRASGLVEFAEPDYIIRASAIPNDPDFSKLWSLQNTTDFDTDAIDAWDFSGLGAAVTVAVIDSGVRYTHEDLAGICGRIRERRPTGRMTMGTGSLMTFTGLMR